MTRKKAETPIREGAGWRAFPCKAPPLGRLDTRTEGETWFRVERAATSESEADEAFVCLAESERGGYRVQWRKGGAGGAFYTNAATSFDDALDQVIKRALRGPTTWRTGPYQQPV